VRPGEIFPALGTIELRAGRARATVRVANTGDRPIQVGSHAHFFEVNEALAFDRAIAYGMCLDIAPGTAIRFEPGIERPVDLVGVGGERRIVGLRGKGRG
jgi:urease beta subunit